MKKLVLTMLLTLSFQLTYAKKYALIIAIGDYPRSTGWSSISSVKDVPLIKQALLSQGFLEDDISTIINEQATKKGILLAIDNVKAKLKKGDVLVVHYSGHGQQIFDDNGDEVDDKDESIVPYDAYVKYTHFYKGENHIRDDELAKIITGIRNTLGKEGQLLFLLDSCHSGSATRGGKARGGEGTFAPENWKPSKTEKPKGSDLIDKTKLNKEDSASFIMISGASANELNYEYQGYGSLSYTFNKVMSELDKDMSYRHFFSKIATSMNVISPEQNPTIEGDLDFKLFKGEYITQQPYYNVQSLLQSDVIKVQAGKLQGLFKGTTVNILPAGTTKVSSDKILAKGKVVLAKFNQVNIKLDKALPTKNRKEYWVFIDKKTYGDISLKVYIDKEKATSKSLETELDSFLKKNNLGSLVSTSEESQVIVSKNNQAYTLNATNNWVEFDKEEDSRNEVNQIESLKQNIFNYAQGMYLKKLKLNNKKYELSFRLLPVDYDVATEEYGEIKEPSVLMKENVFTVKPEVDHVYLEVTNHSKMLVYFSIIEINSKGEIATFMPNDNCTLNDNERQIPAGKTVVFKDCVFSFGPPYEKLMLKAFASNKPINFQSTVQTRGENTKSNSNPLERFLSDTYKVSRGSGSTSVSGAIDGYSTEMIYQIVKE